jgi:hypothetical protein
MSIQWIPDASFSSADRAEHALIGGHELVAFDLPPHQRFPRQIGWELFAGPKLQDLVATGEANSFDDAKLAAEAAYMGASNAVKEPWRGCGDL